MWWLIIPALVLVFLAVIIIRTLLFKPAAEEKPTAEPIEFNGQKAVDDLASMICCKTVSFKDDRLIDEAEFDKFRKLLTEIFPNIHKTCTLTRIGKSGLIYHWKGKAADAPSILMAHYDVVPINPEGWDKPAFEGIIENGILWGRGTLDTKGTLCGVCEAVEHLIGKNFVPEQDLYMAFAGDEEIAGETAPAMVAWFKEQGITPGIVLDEGGAVVENIFPGVAESCALVGIGEKGMAEIEFILDGEGGHASAPPAHTPVGVLAKAVCDVEGHPFKMQISQAAAEMFDTLGRRSSFVYRMIFSNLWCFKPILNAICKKSGGELNALMRTTCAFTMMEGSSASNVIPPHSKISANFRLNGDDTIDFTKQRLEKIINNSDIKVNVAGGQNPSTFSDTSSDAWKKLKKAISQSWQEALVSPYLMIACSDSRHYNAISDKVFRFSAMALSAEERGMIHGNNERIPLETIKKTVEFYLRLIVQL
ncbi:MAG: M20/M25/M40 family metallo-hydrolase [Oscillospiraceae bacterium]